MSKKRILSTAMAIAVLALAPTLFAAPGRGGAIRRPGGRVGAAEPGARPGAALHAGKFWKVPAVRRELALTEEQVDRLDELFRRNQKALIDLKGEVEKSQIDLDAVLADHQADEKKIAAQVDRLEEARAKLGKARMAMLLDARKILTPEQRDKLEQLRQELRERRPRSDRPGRRGGELPLAPDVPGHGEEPVPTP
jgi:Spy/CpxP family protein refolding chaperone